MHEHDLDLIAEYASGLLEGHEESLAADHVRTCDRCAAEFEDQRSVRTLLATAPVPQMTELERTRLRRTVLDTVAPPSTGRVGWQRRFLAATAVAAGVLVTAVGIGVVGQLDGEEEFTLADGGETATTAAAFDQRVPTAESDAAGGDEVMGALSTDDTDEEAEALDDGVTPDGALAPNVLIDAGPLTREQLDSLLTEMTAVVAESETMLPREDAVAFGASCAADLEGELLAVVVASIDDRPTQAFLTGDRAAPTVSVLAGDDCSPLSP